MRWRMHKAAWAVARALMRFILPWTERKRGKLLAEAHRTVHHFTQKFENGKLKVTSMLFNAGLYMMIAQRDIHSAKITALTHPDEWTRKLNARMILLTIYEWNADSVTGRAFRDSMKLMGIPNDLQQETFAALREMRRVKEKAEKKFTLIRNAAIAHRDPDALVQHRAIRDLRVKEVLEVGAEFTAAMGLFLTAHMKLMAASDNFASYAKQWSASMPNETPSAGLQ
jgi:acid stress-induced BolA-like protein IbaG/YrbA